MENITHIPVRDVELYRRAFTHKSATEVPAASYDRLEFLGDSTLNLVIAKYLYDRHPQKNEGYLTRVRTQLVSGRRLAAFAWQLGLQHLVTMDNKGMLNGWNSNPRILEDVFEALIGAIYLDTGIDAAATFITACVDSFVDFRQIHAAKNHKDLLMRYTQTQKMPLPVYHTLDSSTSSLYQVTTIVDGHPRGYGEAPTKKQAQQISAQVALTVLGGKSTP